MNGVRNLGVGRIGPLEFGSREAIYLARVTGLALFYLVAARLGLLLALTPEQVTTIWPPAAIAVVAILAGGYKYLPGVWAGAFLANLMQHEALGVVVGISIGNTLEAVAAVYLLKQFTGFNNFFQGARDLIWFVVLGGILAPIAAATIGSASLCLGHLASWQAYFSVWFVWWFGDAMGILIFAPFLITLVNGRFWGFMKAQMVEFLLLMAFAFGASMLILTTPANPDFPIQPIVYLIFPILIWAALRLALPGVAAVAVILAGTASWATLNKLGPFAGHIHQQQNLMLMQLSIFAVSSTAMFLAISMSRRALVEQELRRRTKELEDTNERMTKIMTGMLDPEENE